MDRDRAELYIENWCVCCGRSIAREYRFCIPCDRKRMKVIDSCVGAGMSITDARSKADYSYPQLYV